MYDLWLVDKLLEIRIFKVGDRKFLGMAYKNFGGRDEKNLGVEVGKIG